MLKIVTVVLVSAGVVVGAKYSNEVNRVLDIDGYANVVDQVLESRTVIEEWGEELVGMFDR